MGTEYGQELTAKMKVAVLHGMMPKDLQDKVLDECAVNWDETTESGAGRLYTKIKATLRNIAKARREMAGPKPMEVDRVADWREWPDDWHGEHSNQGETEEEHHDEKCGDEAYVQYIGKGGGKKDCYICGGFGHSQWDCYKGKGKGKGFGRDGGYGKGYGKDVIKTCPKDTNVQQVEEDVPEILFISSVQNKEALEGWKKMPMKVTLGDFVKDTPTVPIQKTLVGRTGVAKNRFKVLEVDEEDEEEVVNVRQVENSERTDSVVCDFEDDKAKNRVQFVISVIKEEVLGESRSR